MYYLEKILCETSASLKNKVIVIAWFQQFKKEDKLTVRGNQKSVNLKKNYCAQSVHFNLTHLKVDLQFKKIIITIHTFCAQV